MMNKRAINQKSRLWEILFYAITRIGVIALWRIITTFYKQFESSSKMCTITFSFISLKIIILASQSTNFANVTKLFCPEQSKLFLIDYLIYWLKKIDF